MYCAHLTIDRSEINREHPCHRYLPFDVENENLDISIKACSMSDEGSGYSIIRITDSEDSIPTGKFTSKGGSSLISRVAPGHYVAMVNNDKCFLASLINQSGCFLTSAVPITDTQISWTVLGPDGEHLHILFNKLRENGYKFIIDSMGDTSINSLLTPKQEKCFNKAVEMGYYDVPKKVDLGDMAKSLGCSKSTLNVTLRTAERNIFKFYYDTYLLSHNSFKMN